MFFLNSSVPIISVGAPLNYSSVIDPFFFKAVIGQFCRKFEESDKEKYRSVTVPVFKNPHCTPGLRCPKFTLTHHSGVVAVIRFKSVMCSSFVSHCVIAAVLGPLPHTKQTTRCNKAVNHWWQPLPRTNTRPYTFLYSHREIRRKLDTTSSLCQSFKWEPRICEWLTLTKLTKLYMWQTHWSKTFLMQVLDSAAVSSSLHPLGPVQYVSSPVSSPSFSHPPSSAPRLFPGVCLMDWCYYLYLLHPSVFKGGRWLYLSSFSVLKRRLGRCTAPLPVWEKLGGKKGERLVWIWQQIDSGNNQIPFFIMSVIYTEDGCLVLSDVNQAPDCMWLQFVDKGSSINVNKNIKPGL